MKKYFTFFVLFLAIAGYGISIHATSADTLTPEQQAALQQSLYSMNEQLLELQAEAATTQPTAQPQANSADHMHLSSEEASELNAALSSLAIALKDIQVAASNNPQFIVTNGPVVASSLGGIKNTIASIADAIEEQPSSQTIADNSNTKMIAPTTVAAAQPTTVTGAQEPSVPTNNTPTTNVAANSQTDSNSSNNQTAQVVSFESILKNDWIEILVALLLIVGIVIWARHEDPELASAKTTTVTKQSSVQQTTVTSVSKPATPLSTAIGSAPDNSGSHS